MNKYIPNPDKIKVGYGYRLLGDNEAVLYTDSICCFPKNKKVENLLWDRVGYNWKSLEEWKFTYPGYNIYVRREIEIPAEYRLLGPDETTISNETKYITYHNTKFGSGEWDDIKLGCKSPKLSYSSSNLSYEETDGIAYIVRVSKMNNTNELENQLKAAKVAIENAQKAAKELEDKLEKAKIEEIKVGDWVFVLTDLEFDNCLKGTVGKVTDAACDCFKIEQLNNAKLKRYFRKATNEEIEKHLLDKAAKDGWIVGAKFRNVNDTIDTIEKLLVSFNGKGSSYSVEMYYDKIKEPFVYVNSDGGRSSRPLAELILMKEDLITIVVDGTTYTAEFTKVGYANYVKFGCATIREEQITHALKLLENDNSSVDKIKNRKIEAVQIGKGIFNLELLKKLAAKFK